MTRGVLVCVLFVLGGAAHADTPKLAAARRAVRDVRYDDARGLLVEALEAGDHGPDELREIYQLSAATAVVLGQSDLAEQYYRRVLALDPAARLPADASPKLRPPFVAAQAYMAAQGRLDARAIRRGAQIEVTVTADPLGMVAAVTAIGDGAARPKRAVPGQPIVLSPGGTVAHVALLDEHGNTLRAIAVAAAVAGEGDLAGGDGAPATPLVRRWVTWAIPAAVLAATGVGFAIGAQRANDRLDAILAASPSHFFDEAKQQRDRVRTDTWIAGVAFVAAGACTVTAIVLAVTRPSSAHLALVPTVVGRQVGVALGAKF